MAYYCSTGFYWSLGQNEILKSSPRPIQVVLSSFWVSMVIINAEMYDRVKELPQGISQEASQCYLKYEVEYILDEF